MKAFCMLSIHVSSNAGTVEQMLLIIAKIAPKSSAQIAAFITTKKVTHVTIHLFRSMKKTDEENNADDVSVMTTNDIWDESDRSYPVSDDVDSDDRSDADVHIVERTMSRARSYSFAILVESFRFQVPSPNCFQHLVSDLSGNLWISDGESIFLVEKNGEIKCALDCEGDGILSCGY